MHQARYAYKNQAPELLATPTLTRAYRHAVEEAAVYTAAAPNFTMATAVGGIQKR